jgi:hypothetical protein
MYEAFTLFAPLIVFVILLGLREAYLHIASQPAQIIRAQRRHFSPPIQPWRR